MTDLPESPQSPPSADSVNPAPTDWTPAVGAPSTPSSPVNTMGLIALVIGIVAGVTALIPGFSFATWLFSIPAIILGVIAGLRKFKPHKAAWAGVITGGSAWVVAIVVSVVFIAATAGTSVPQANQGPIPSATVQPTEAPTESAEPSVVPSAEPSITPTPEPEAPAGPVAGADYGGYPKDEAAFVAQIEKSTDGIADASTDLQRSHALRERDKALCGILKDRKASKWVGRILEIGANGDGYAFVRIEISPTVVVQTWNNAFSDYGDNTLIKPSKPFFDDLVAMDEDTDVMFSTKFLSSSDGCLKGANITETFYGSDPNFITRFSDIHAQ